MLKSSLFNALHEAKKGKNPAEDKAIKAIDSKKPLEEPAKESKPADRSKDTSKSAKEVLNTLDPSKRFIIKNTDNLDYFQSLLNKSAEQGAIIDTNAFNGLLPLVKDLIPQSKQLQALSASGNRAAIELLSTVDSLPAANLNLADKSAYVFLSLFVFPFISESLVSNITKYPDLHSNLSGSARAHSESTLLDVLDYGSSNLGVTLANFDHVPDPAVRQVLVRIKAFVTSPQGDVQKNLSTQYKSGLRQIEKGFTESASKQLMHPKVATNISKTLYYSIVSSLIPNWLELFELDNHRLASLRKEASKDILSQRAKEFIAAKAIQIEDDPVVSKGLYVANAKRRLNFEYFKSLKQQKKELAITTRKAAAGKWREVDPLDAAARELFDNPQISTLISDIAEQFALAQDYVLDSQAPKTAMQDCYNKILEICINLVATIEADDSLDPVFKTTMAATFSMASKLRKVDIENLALVKAVNDLVEAAPVIDESLKGFIQLAINNYKASRHILSKGNSEALFTVFANLLNVSDDLANLLAKSTKIDAQESEKSVSGTPERVALNKMKQLYHDLSMRKAELEVSIKKLEADLEKAKLEKATKKIESITTKLDAAKAELVEPTASGKTIDAELASLDTAIKSYWTQHEAQIDTIDIPEKELDKDVAAKIAKAKAYRDQHNLRRSSIIKMSRLLKDGTFSRVITTLFANLQTQISTAPPEIKQVLLNPTLGLLASDEAMQNQLKVEELEKTLASLEAEFEATEDKAVKANLANQIAGITSEIDLIKETSVDESVFDSMNKYFTQVVSSTIKTYFMAQAAPFKYFTSDAVSLDTVTSSIVSSIMGMAQKGVLAADVELKTIPQLPIPEKALAFLDLAASISYTDEDPLENKPLSLLEIDDTGKIIPKFKLDKTTKLAQIFTGNYLFGEALPESVKLSPAATLAFRRVLLSKLHPILVKTLSGVKRDALVSPEETSEVLKDTSEELIHRLKAAIPAIEKAIAAADDMIIEAVGGTTIQVTFIESQGPVFYEIPLTKGHGQYLQVINKLGIDIFDRLLKSGSDKIPAAVTFIGKVIQNPAAAEEQLKHALTILSTQINKLSLSNMLSLGLAQDLQKALNLSDKVEEAGSSRTKFIEEIINDAANKINSIYSDFDAAVWNIDDKYGRILNQSLYSLINEIEISHEMYSVKSTKALKASQELDAKYATALEQLRSEFPALYLGLFQSQATTQTTTTLDAEGELSSEQVLSAEEREQVDAAQNPAAIADALGKRRLGIRRDDTTGTIEHIYKDEETGAIKIKLYKQLTRKLEDRYLKIDQKLSGARQIVLGRDRKTDDRYLPVKSLSEIAGVTLNSVKFLEVSLRSIFKNVYIEDNAEQYEEVLSWLRNLENNISKVLRPVLDLLAKNSNNIELKDQSTYMQLFNALAPVRKFNVQKKTMPFRTLLDELFTDKSDVNKLTTENHAAIAFASAAQYAKATEITAAMVTYYNRAKLNSEKSSEEAAALSDFDKMLATIYKKHNLTTPSDKAPQQASNSETIKQQARTLVSEIIAHSNVLINNLKTYAATNNTTQLTDIATKHIYLPIILDGNTETALTALISGDSDWFSEIQALRNVQSNVVSVLTTFTPEQKAIIRNGVSGKRNMLTKKPVTTFISSASALFESKNAYLRFLMESEDIDNTGYQKVSAFIKLFDALLSSNYYADETTLYDENGDPANLPIRYKANMHFISSAAGNTAFHSAKNQIVSFLNRNEFHGFLKPDDSKEYIKFADFEALSSLVKINTSENDQTTE